MGEALQCLTFAIQSEKVLTAKISVLLIKNKFGTEKTKHMTGKQYKTLACIFLYVARLVLFDSSFTLLY